MSVHIIRKRRNRWLSMLCCLLFAVLAAAGGAEAGTGEGAVINTSGNRNERLSVDPVRKNEGYSAILYDNRNGLPTSEANAIAQTGEGFLWIGCYAGLIRYDGNSFERMDTGIPIPNVRCLYVDSLDRLWIGSNDSGLFLMERTGIRRWTKSDGLPSASIRAVAEDGGGSFYILGAVGTAVIGPDMRLTVLTDERIAGQEIREIRRGADGLMYGVTHDGDLFTMQDGEIITFLSRGDCRVKGIRSIFPDPEKPGNLYLGTEESRIYYGSLGNNFASMGMKDISPLSDVNSFESIDGQIWICTDKGIGNLNDEGFSRLRNVPMNSSVEHVMTDYEGNLWFTSSRQGITKIVPNPFTDLSERYDLAPTIVNSTCMYGSRLFMATDNGLVVTERGMAVDRLPLTRAVTASGKELGATDLLAYLQGTRIRSVVQDSRGRLWISTWRRLGLICYKDQEITAFTTEDGLLSDRVRVVCECEDGSILAANSGVSIIRDGKVAASYSEEDGIDVPSILTVAEGFGGGIILGSDGGGIYVIRGNETKRLGIEDGLSSEVILRIKRSRDGKRYWIVTSNSLAYMTPDDRITTIGDFPYANNYDLYENSRGDVWVVSSNGLYKVSAEELLSGESVTPSFYGIAGGLPYTATANSYSELTEEGDLYIAGSAGVVKVNIEKPFEDLSKLKVALPFVDIDGKRTYPDAAGTFTVPRKAVKLTIYPFVFSYSLTDLQVSYRLEGFDTEETEVSRSGMTPVNYTNLREGEYRFMIRVEDPTGDIGRTADFRIVKEKVLSDEAAGTIIMDITSLFFLTGILIYSSLYRKRGRVDDRMFFGLVVTTVILAAVELSSYLMEYDEFPFMRELMYAQNTVFYAALAFFPYLFLLFLDYRASRDEKRLRRIKIIYGIPLVLYLVLLAVNLGTGWIFSITAQNAYHSGPADQIVFVPILFYFAAAETRAYKINPHLVLLGLILIGTRVAWDFWTVGISSISFIYTLFLVCTHIHVVNLPLLNKEGT